MSSVKLEWSSLSCSLESRRGSRKLLDNVFGVARPGKLLAIMGPSGSGKTTLLNAISGTLALQKGLRLEGSVLVNGSIVAHGVASVGKGYVQQEDVFYSQMTVRETLLFTARLRLPSEMSLEKKEAFVTALIDKLALTKAAGTIVGDAKVRGISGGERKRLSIACELMGNPNLLFLDEPTSGLDAFQAERVVSSLKELTKEGKTVLVVIHQPSGEVFNMFDDLLLLSEGRTVYAGPASSLTAYMELAGHKFPQQYSPAEYALRLVSVNHESPGTEEVSRALVAKLSRRALESVAQSKEEDGSALSVAAGTVAPVGEELLALSPQAPFREQFRLLLSRSWREVSRNRFAAAVKCAQQVGIALIYGGIYTLSDSQSSAQDRIGLLSMVAIGNFVSPLAATIRSFPREKTIVVKERERKLYSTLPYFLAKVVAEAPMTAVFPIIFGCTIYPLVGLQRSWPKFATFLSVGVLHAFASSSVGLLLSAMAPSSDAALAMLPPVVVLMNIFNGFVISEENCPRVLWMLPKLSLIRWAWEGLCVNEFDGLRFRCDRLVKNLCVHTGKEALLRMSTSFESASIKKSIMAQTSITAGCYLLTYGVLVRSGPRPAQLHDNTPPTRASLLEGAEASTQSPRTPRTPRTPLGGYVVTRTTLSETSS